MSSWREERQLYLYFTLLYNPHIQLGGGVNLSQEFGVFSSSSEPVAAEFTNNASSDGHYKDTAVRCYADGSAKFC